MEEAKLKKIEERLYQLFAKVDETRNEKPSVKRTSNGVRVIRRRKGKPDLYIPWKRFGTSPLTWDILKGTGT